MSDSGRGSLNRDLGRCLVTGAGGFIGSHLVEALASEGRDVRALVRYVSDGGEGWLADVDDDVRDHVEVIHGDVRDPDQMRAITRGCRTVFHLAALIGIPYSYTSPRQNLDTNAVGTLNVLEAARDAGVERLVHTSSSEVYGTAQYVPIDENHPLVGQSPYSATKIAADQMVISYARAFDLPALIVRPFNTFGPRQSLRAVIPTIITQALWSDRVRLGALDTTRDFTFVSDTAGGLMAAAGADGANGGVFNLGYGQDISIRDLTGLVGELLGRDISLEQEGERLRPPSSEVERLLSDPSRARAAFGWNPRVSLREGLRLTIEWIQSRGAERSVAEFVR